MKYRSESVPGYGDPLLDQIDETDTQNGGSSAETIVSAPEEAFVLAHPKGTSDDVPFGVDNIERPVKPEIQKPLSDIEFAEKREAGALVQEIADYVDKAEFIPAHLYQKAQALNDPFLNEYILSLPDNTVVYLDENGDKEKTIFEIREHAAYLREQSSADSVPDSLENQVENPAEETRQHRVAAENRPATEPESRGSNLEDLFAIAQTKDELIAIVAKSKDLESGLEGTQQEYSKDDLIALIEATWTGEIGIDHLPRAAGFREAVDRVREIELSEDQKIAKRTTAEELEPAMEATMRMEHGLDVPEHEQIYGHAKEKESANGNSPDKASYAYNYEKYPRTEENRKKNTGIFGKLWAYLKNAR
jgi:hypothetical protein